MVANDPAPRFFRVLVDSIDGAVLLHWHTSDRTGADAVHARAGELVLDPSSWARLRPLIADSSIITLVEPPAGTRS